MAFWISCLHNISKFSSFAKVSYLWSGIIHSDGDMKWQVGNSMTDIILLFHLIQYFVLKGSFERMASAHGDENPQSSWNLFKSQFQCCTDTRECSGLTRTFLESPRRIGGPEVFIFTPPSPIPGLLLRSVVELALICCRKGWFVVDGTERQCKRNVKRVKNG